MQNLDKLSNLPMGVESDWSMLEHVSSVSTAIVLIPVHPGMYSRGLDWPTEQAKAWTAALVEPPQQAVVQLAHQPVHLAQPMFAACHWLLSSLISWTSDCMLQGTQKPC